MKARLVVMLLVIFLYGCATGYSVVEEKNLSDKPKLRNDSKKIEEKKEEKKEIKYDVEDERERRLRAKGFGIFDFNKLNKKNCLDNYETYRVKIHELREDIEIEERELKREKKDVENAEQEYGLALQSGNENAAKSKRESLDQEVEEFEEQEDKLDELNELLSKLLIIVKEIDKECKRLLAEN